MDKKKIASIKRRILRANQSFSIGGDMLLCLEMDAMTPLDRITLRDALLSQLSPVRYKYLDTLIERELNKV